MQALCAEVTPTRSHCVHGQCSANVSAAQHDHIQGCTGSWLQLICLTSVLPVFFPSGCQILPKCHTFPQLLAGRQTAGWPYKKSQMSALLPSAFPSLWAWGEGGGMGGDNATWHVTETACTEVETLPWAESQGGSAYNTASIKMHHNTPPPRVGSSMARVLDHPTRSLAPKHMLPCLCMLLLNVCALPCLADA